METNENAASPQQSLPRVRNPLPLPSIQFISCYIMSLFPYQLRFWPQLVNLESWLLMLRLLSTRERGNAGTFNQQHKSAKAGICRYEVWKHQVNGKTCSKYEPLGHTKINVIR